MKKYAGINYRQRPKSYWRADASILALLLRNVKGTQRRRMIRDYYNEGRLEQLETELLRESLSEETRIRLSRIHPSFMGGEYLPDCADKEVEIARIELKSADADVISIRARHKSAGIRYSVVNEYESDFKLQRKTSRQPLTLRQLIEFIEGSKEEDVPGGLALGFNQMNVDRSGVSRDEMRHFTTISSEFYPQLRNHFERVFDEWVRNGVKSVEGNES